MNHPHPTDADAAPTADYERAEAERAAQRLKAYWLGELAERRTVPYFDLDQRQIGIAVHVRGNDITPEHYACPCGCGVVTHIDCMAGLLDRATWLPSPSFVAKVEAKITAEAKTYSAEGDTEIAAAMFEQMIASLQRAGLPIQIVRVSPPRSEEPTS